MTLIRRNGPYGQLILFGDSLTEMSAIQAGGFNFMPALQNWYMRKLDVINRGFSGYTTRSGLDVLPEFMPTPEQAHVRLLLVFFGANDACVPGMAQHVPLDEYKNNLRSIVEHPYVQAHRPSILLITPPPLNEHAAEGPAPRPRARIAENTRRYAQAVLSAGVETNTPVLDLWGYMMKMAGWREGQPLLGSRDVPESAYLRNHFVDGLHFSPFGYKVLFDSVRKAIELYFPEQTGPALPSPFPPWREVCGIETVRGFVVDRTEKEADEGN